MMVRRSNWRVLAAALLFGVSGTLSGSAQEQPAAASKFKVLVPALEKRGAGKDVGKDVADELRKLIARMPRHEPVENKEVKSAFQKYGLKENEMDCIKNRQLAVQLNAELVMCGAFTQNGGAFTFDSVSFISTKTQEAFQLQPITAASAKEAAGKIYEQFERYINTIERLGFCYTYLESQQWQQAIENCEAALQVNPLSPRANMGKAFAIFNLAGTGEATDTAKLRESLALYKRVLEINPIEQEALRTAGIVAARLGQQNESRNYFKQYLELNPGDVSVRLSIAGEQARAGDPEGALRVVEEGLKADSASTDLLTWAAIFAGQAGFRAQEASRRAGGSTDLSPQARALFETSVSYYRRAFELQNAAVEPAAADRMISSLVMLGRAQEAVDLARRAVAGKLGSSGLVWAAYAAALANANRTAEALAAFDTAIARNDTAATGLHLRKAGVQLANGDLAGARAAYRAAVTAGQAKNEEVADAIINAGLLEPYAKKSYDTFLQYLEVAGGFADSELTRSKISFWTGMVFYARAAAAGTPQKAADARRILPLYQRALGSLEAGATFGRSNPQYRYAETLSAVRQYINYLQEVIRRG